jgi:hypothetical protein
MLVFDSYCDTMRLRTRAPRRELPVSENEIKRAFWDGWNSTGQQW